MIKIRTFNKADFETLRNIYQLGINTGNATFEIAAPDWEEWNLKFQKSIRLVAEENENVVGWAGLIPVSKRAVYKGVSEVSVYVHPNTAGKGVGKLLLENIIRLSEQQNIWTLQASIFPENTVSIHLHTYMGFRRVGIRKKIGKMLGKWRDTILMERRSEVAGVE